MSHSKPKPERPNPLPEPDLTRQGRSGPEMPVPSELRIEAILEHITDAFFALDEEGCFTYLNRRAEELLHRKREELLGRNVWEAFPEAVGSTFYQNYLRLREFGEPVHYEEFYHPWGTWFEVRGYLAEGCLSIYFRDVTERKRVEDELRTSEERLRLMVEQMPALLWTTDTDLRVTSVQGAGLKALKMVPNETVGMTLYDYFQTQDSNHPYIAPHLAALRGQSRSMESDWLGRMYRTQIEPLRQDGQIIGSIGVAHDITELHQAQEELNEYARRLLDVQEHERRHLARELHDEIGQLLTGLKLSVEMGARVCGADSEGRKHLAEALQLVHDITTQVRNLSLALRPTMLDDLGLLPALLWLINRYQTQMHLNVQFKHHGLERRFDPALETGVFRIVQEALTNVVRYAQVSSAIVVVFSDERDLFIEIQDKGVGFDVAQVLNRPNLAHQAHNPYVVDNQVRQHTSCSGLRGIQERVKLLCGEESIESTPGAGTRIKARLPINQIRSGERELGSEQ